MENDKNKPAENKSYYDKEIEHYNQLKNDIEKWRQEIEQSAPLQDYLSRFHPQSIKSFINSYIGNKNLWMSFGESCKVSNEEEALQWETAASRHLQYIQQKKLFDLQCLWRAEEVKVEGIEISYDFEICEDDILNCNLIEPISEQDIDLYSQFLLRCNLDTEVDDWFYFGWQKYDDIKAAYNNSEHIFDFPEWYDFHNVRTGAGALLLLPDIRGEKESFYENLYHESIKEATEARYKEMEAKKDKRPWINYFDEGMVEQFVNTFENKQVRENYKAYMLNNRNNSLEESIHDNVALLLTAEERVPIEAHYNWIEALERATKKYRYKKIAEALPTAWERYLINIETGIRFPEGKAIHQSARHMVVEAILKGRVLNGEPADFNF